MFLSDCSDDHDTSAYMVGQNVPLPTESAGLTPTASAASAAVDTEKRYFGHSHHG